MKLKLIHFKNGNFTGYSSIELFKEVAPIDYKESVLVAICDFEQSALMQENCYIVIPDELTDNDIGSLGFLPSKMGVVYE